jgi:uncharacterized protein (TIGR03437 family)
MARLSFPSVFLVLLSVGCFCAPAQTTFLTCLGTPTPLLVRAEGLTERVGDIQLKCTGGLPGAHVMGNFVISLNVPITNRIAPGFTTDVVFTIDNGSGPQPPGVPGILQNQSSVVFDGLSFTLSPNGTVDLRVSNVRANVTSLPLAPVGSVIALLAFNPGTALPVPGTQFTVAYPARGLYAGFSEMLVCYPQGSLLPDNLTSFAAFLTEKTVFASTRVTEGFADAFGPLSAPANFHADSGQRIIASYSGFPSGARLFVPEVIAGSDAVQPTAGGDLGVPASGGKYAPGGNGSLLLARVKLAGANGAGGVPAYTAGPSGSGTVSFDAISEVALTNGSGYVVYEVVDADPSTQENAQFPTFLGLAPSGGGNPIVTSEDVSFAPTSTVGMATAKDPIPRFSSVPAPPDCPVVGDCNAPYFPRLFVDTTPLQFAAPAGSGHQVKYFIINNRSGGLLNWTASVTYTNGSGWLELTPDFALNNATVRVDAIPANLAPGTYNAVITVDAGPIAGSKMVPVTFVVGPPGPQPPSITSVVNAASFVAGPVVPGSLSTIMGTHLSGTNVSVTFDAAQAAILFDNDSQINLLVPSSLGASTTSQLVVTVDGASSTPQSVAVAPFSPAIFPGAILNQDNSVNNAAHPAPKKSVIQIFATGLSGIGPITAMVGNDTIVKPYYAGPAPGLPGVQQVNILLPADLVGPSVNVVLCGAGTNPFFQVCGPPAPLALQ